MITVIFIILYFSFLQFCVDGFQNCKEIDISVTQKIENEGFHREIHWLLESPLRISPRCMVGLELTVPSGMYVNPDELADLNRLGEIIAVIKGVVDVEKPLQESEEHKVYIYLPNFIGRTSVQLPIHLRYQQAIFGGGYGKVVLQKPLLLLNCSGLDIVCDMPEIKAPCNINSKDLCIWHNVSYESLFHDVELSVPIGNLDDYPLVSIITLLLGCLATIYILSILSNSSI